MATSRKTKTRTEHVMVNLTKPEKALVRKWAKVDGRMLGEWVRINAVVAAISREAGFKKKRPASTKRNPEDWAGQGSIE